MTETISTAMGITRAVCIALLLLTAPAAADPALFVVRGGRAPLYLFGSIHILRRGVEYNTSALDKAFHEAKTCWFETVDPPSTAMLLQLLPGMDLLHPLKPQLDLADQARLTGAVDTFMPGAMPLIDHMRPWLAAMVLIAVRLKDAIPADSGHGVDDQIMAWARKNQKPTLGLETLASLVTLMNSLPQADQIGLLHDTLDPGPHDAKTFRKLETTWLAGDLDKLAHAVDGGGAVQDILVARRNALWAEQLDHILHEPDPVLVTVGALHLAGPGNLRDLLTRRGYTVERLQ